MKYTFNILLIFVLFQSSAQNLVPDPSFEDTAHCPISLGDTYSLNSWQSYSVTPDYYHTCNTDPFPSCGVPANWYGYQQPHSGNAYWGMITYGTGSGNYREIIGSELTSPLIVGTKYNVSAYVCSANCSMEGGVFSNHLGFQFTTQSYNELNPAPVNNYAQVWFDTIITDTLNWVCLIGSFVADSAYTSFGFGNFFTDSATQFIDLMGCGSMLSYYYVDDISVFPNTSVGIYELTNPKKKLIKIVDTMGRETDDKLNTLLFYIYSDGTTEKVFITE
jgi:hypothetical protein